MATPFCRLRRRRKGRGSRRAGETVGLPGGASPARSEATQREGAARLLRIGVNKRVARIFPLAGTSVMLFWGTRARSAPYPARGVIILLSTMNKQGVNWRPHVKGFKRVKERARVTPVDNHQNRL